MIRFGPFRPKKKNSLDPGYLTEAEVRRLPFAKLGKNVQIARNTTVIGAEFISIGNNVRIDGFCTIIAAGGSLRLGDFVHIGGACHINASSGLQIGDFSTLSQGVRIYTKSDDFSGTAMTNSTVPREFKKVIEGEVVIGRHVVIGSGSIVLPGCYLEDGVAVGALSLVKESLFAWKIYAGTPARAVRNRDMRALELEGELFRTYFLK